MTATVTVATGVELTFFRGVDFYEEFTALLNAGTEASPTQGLPLNLSEWPTITAQLKVSTTNEGVRATCAVISAEAGRFSLLVPHTEFDRAFAGTANRPIFLQIRASNSAGNRQRVLMAGKARVRESGYHPA